MDEDPHGASAMTQAPNARSAAGDQGALGKERRWSHVLTRVPGGPYATSGYAERRAVVASPTGVPISSAPTSAAPPPSAHPSRKRQPAGDVAQTALAALISPVQIGSTWTNTARRSTWNGAARSWIATRTATRTGNCNCDLARTGVLGRSQSASRRWANAIPIGSCHAQTGQEAEEEQS
jgi:hypothetical protein